MFPARATAHIEAHEGTSARDLDESAPPVDQGEAAEASPGLEADEVPPRPETPLLLGLGLGLGLGFGLGLGLG